MSDPARTEPRHQAMRGDAGAMRLARALARLGCGYTHPNPRVGAVAIRDGKIVGLGAHLGFGGPHAEATLIDHADPDELRDATLFVTLEPCAHFGKTPPCTERIVRAGIRTVVSSIGDPGPLVSGRGYGALRSLGIELRCGVETEAAVRLNAPYFWKLRRGRPFVTLKLAVSLDGRLAAADGSSRWVSGPQAREMVHRWRACCDAIVIGRGTFISDRPKLSARPRVDPLRRLRERIAAAQDRWPHQPARIIVDSRARLGGDADLVEHMRRADGGQWVVACGSSADERSIARLEAAGVSCWRLPEAGASGGVDLAALLGRAAGEGWLDIIVEGGRTLAAEMMRRGLVDRVRLFIAPLLLGGANVWLDDIGVQSIAKAVPLGKLRARKLGRDILIDAYSAAAEELLREIAEDRALACSPD